MNKFQQMPMSVFFGKFIKDCECYDLLEFGVQFEKVHLSDWFLERSGLSDKKYGAVAFVFDDSVVEVYDEDGQELIYSLSIECSVR